MEKVCNDKSTGSDFDCHNCEIPSVEPEDCEPCTQMAEDDGVDYEANFTHVTGTWTCEHCGMGV